MRELRTDFGQDVRPPALGQAPSTTNSSTPSIQHQLARRDVTVVHSRRFNHETRKLLTICTIVHVNHAVRVSPVQAHHIAAAQVEPVELFPRADPGGLGLPAFYEEAMEAL